MFVNHPVTLNTSKTTYSNYVAVNKEQGIITRDCGKSELICEGRDVFV
jgi:hypothetical protein